MKLTTIRDIAVTMASATVVAAGPYAIRDNQKWLARQEQQNAEHKASMAKIHNLADYAPSAV